MRTAVSRIGKVLGGTDDLPYPDGGCNRVFRTRKMDNSTWQMGVQSIHEEAAGVLDVNLIDASVGADLFISAALGNCESTALLAAIRKAAECVRSAPRRKPALCVSCPRSIRRITPTTVFGVARPAVPTPTGALAFAFCDRCSADPSTLAVKATEGLRRIWPDLRPIKITDPFGGRA